MKKGTKIKNLKKNEYIWYAMIGDVLFEEMINKVNRDSRLLD